MRIKTLLTPLLGVAVLSACEENDPQPETPPRQLSSSTFHYPEELWDANVEGETTLEIFISEGGTVDTARVGESSGYEAFDSVAVAGAHDLRFEPATRGNAPVGTWVLLPVRFDMPRDDEGGEDTP